MRRIKSFAASDGYITDEETSQSVKFSYETLYFIYLCKVWIYNILLKSEFDIS